jgi:16S rRNA (uracil1498-N3)-methyltransferase
LFDGVGHEFLVCVESISKRTTVLAIVKDIVPSSPESPLDLTLAVALTKGEKFELVIQKSVELGVNRIIPIVTQRCDIKPYSSGKRIAEELVDVMRQIRRALGRLDAQTP